LNLIRKCEMRRYKNGYKFSHVSLYGFEIEIELGKFLFEIKPSIFIIRIIAYCLEIGWGFECRAMRFTLKL